MHFIPFTSYIESGSRAARIWFAACLLVLTEWASLAPAQTGLHLSGRDVSIDRGYWFYDGTDFAAAGENRELKGPGTHVLHVPDLYINGTLIIKDGARLEMFPGDGVFHFGANYTRKPDVDTVVDISGPGSSLYAINSANNYELLISGRSRSTTINISDGGSLVIEQNTTNGLHLITAARYTDDPSRLTINVSGGGSRLAVIHPPSADWLDIEVPLVSKGPAISLSRGGLLDLRNAAMRVGHPRLRYTIGDDGTGKSASGLFRMRDFHLYGAEISISVDPCTTLKPGDKFPLTEAVIMYNTAREVQRWVDEQGVAIEIPNGGLYRSGGYTFAIDYNAQLGYNYPGTNRLAMGIVATVVGVPRGGRSDAVCGKVPVTVGSNENLPFTVTGPGCSPGLYWGSETLFMESGANCRIAHHPMTPISEGVAHVLVNWPDGETAPVRNFPVTNTSALWVAKFNTRYLLDYKSNPAGGGTVNGAGYYDPGTVATIQAVPAPGFHFAGWDGPVANRWEDVTSVTVAKPTTVSLNLTQGKARALISVPNRSVDASRQVLIELSADLNFDRPPAVVESGAAWGKLRLTLAGKLVGEKTVLGAGTYRFNVLLPSGLTLTNAIVASFTPEPWISHQVESGTAQGMLYNFAMLK